MAIKTRLTEEQVEIIRALALNGAKKADIANYFGVSPQLVQYYTNHITRKQQFKEILAKIQEAEAQI